MYLRLHIIKCLKKRKKQKQILKRFIKINFNFNYLLFIINTIVNY